MTGLLLLLLPASLALDPAPDHVVTSLTYGYIDWSALRLEVTAASARRVGAWMDRRVQEQDALDWVAPRVEEAGPTVVVTPDETAGDLIAADDELSQRLREGLENWRVSETRYVASGRVEMDAELDLGAWLRPALVARARADAPALSPDGATGVVVDARGLAFEPCLAPALLSPDGTQLFGATSLSVETVRRSTPVVFALDPADTRAYARAGARPLFAHAGEARGCALVLDAPDAAVIAASPDLEALGAAGGVVLVVDP